MREAIILDTETTGVDKPDVVELAWQEFNFGGTVDAPSSASLRFFPSKEMTFGALAVHHILLSSLVGAPPSSEAPASVPSASYWIGHNVDFDWKALGAPQSQRRICTLAMCRTVWPKCDSHSLGAMMYFLFGPVEPTRRLVAEAHSAAADVAMCEMILGRICSDAAISSMAALYEFSEDCRIPKIMTFGKCKGEPVSAVDKGWANWYARQEDPDPYLIQALKRARKL